RGERRRHTEGAIEANALGDPADRDRASADADVKSREDGAKCRATACRLDVAKHMSDEDRIRSTEAQPEHYCGGDDPGAGATKSEQRESDRYEHKRGDQQPAVTQPIRPAAGCRAADQNHNPEQREVEAFRVGAILPGVQRREACDAAVTERIEKERE